MRKDSIHMVWYAGGIFSSCYYCFSLESLEVGGSDDMAMYSIPCPVSNLSDLPIPGTSGWGRSKKTWTEYVKTDVSICGLAAIDPQDRATWRAAVLDIAWCCQPYRMGHGQHPNLKMDMDGWFSRPKRKCFYILFYHPQFVQVNDDDFWVKMEVSFSFNFVPSKILTNQESKTSLRKQQ